MRDYAELGRQRVRGRRAGAAAQHVGFARVWALASSGGVTAALVLLLALILFLEAMSGGTWGPVEEPGRLGPLMMRLLLSLLTVNLIAVAAQRAEGWWRGVQGPSVEVARPLGKRAQAPLAAWEGVLKGAGARGVRVTSGALWGERSGLVAWVGVTALHMAALALLWHHALSVDDPHPAELTLVEGQPVEALQLPTKRAGVVRRQPLQIFTGYRFDIEGAEQLRALLSGATDSVSLGQGAALVMNRAGEQGDGVRVAFNARGEATLYDKTVLRLKEARNDARPAGATFSVSLADGQLFKKRVGRGHTLAWPGGPGFSVIDLDADRGGQGAAVKLMPIGGGEAFWMYAQAPTLVASRLPPGVGLEVVEVHNGLVLTLEVVPPQGGLLPALGVSLLLLGGALLLLRPSTTLTLRDEGDRLTIEGSSINDAAGLPIRLQALAQLCADSPPALAGGPADPTIDTSTGQGA
jgi:hypothetical protein